jgi:hypothetical protein
MNAAPSAIQRATLVVIANAIGVPTWDYVCGCVSRQLGRRPTLQTWHAIESRGWALRTDHRGLHITSAGMVALGWKAQ